MIRDGIRVNGRHSFYDFGLMLSARRDETPARRTARQSVPYMNGFYDFSAVGGEVCWGERRLEYEFDLIAAAPQGVERIKDALRDWLGNAQETEIFDDTAPGFHYLGSCEALDFEDDESGLASTLTAAFVCQPFKIANRETRVVLRAGGNIVHNPGQSALARVDCEGGCTLTMDGQAQEVRGSDVELLAPLRRGCNAITLSGESAVLRWRVEVL